MNDIYAKNNHSNSFGWKIFFISLGCPKNLVDSEMMMAALVDGGMTIIDNPEGADVIVVNTCAFINSAKTESVDTILEMVEYKKKGDCRILVVAGCLSQRYRSRLADSIPEIDIIIGTSDFGRIFELIDGWHEKRIIDIGDPNNSFDWDMKRLYTAPNHLAYVKIAEGCSHGCAFCVIPKLRGKFRSRSKKSILNEIAEYCRNGVREISLIAQDSTAYMGGSDYDIASLLDDAATIADGLWIRLMYAYPKNFPMGIFDAMKSHSNICRYIDIPIQHISNSILRSMNRGGTRDVRFILDEIRGRYLGISVRTSLIVGYPGETEGDFQALADFVREYEFDNLGVFQFSPEEGTMAFSLDGRIPPDVAEARKNEIMKIQREISLRNNLKLIGKKIRVLVDGLSPETDLLFEARHEGQAKDIDGVVYINDGNPVAGEFCDVIITEAHEYDLVGRVVE